MNFFDTENAGLHWGFLASLLAAIGIVLTTRWHGKHTLDGTAGVQKFHFEPTPRIGGAAIMAGLVAAWAVSSAALRELLGPVLLASLPAFLFGVGEDLTKRVGVRPRLLATMASGAVAWLLTGASVDSIGVRGVDTVLAFTPAAVLFTAFAVGGVANAINIIDGFNGLASGTVAICVAALGLIAQGAGDAVLASLCFTVCAVAMGFFLVNFPFGKLFLGDGGAYLLGFLLAWLAVMLAWRNPQVSVWAPLLACAYPVFETLFTIGRRIWAGTHPFEPDSRHLHSLVKFGIALRLFPQLRADLRNAAVAPFSWGIAAVPAVLAVAFAGDTGALVVACLLSFGLYVGFYAFVAAASRTRRQQLAKVVPLADVAADGVVHKRRVS